VVLSKAQEKAYDFAQELVKQIITLSSAIITVSIAFLKDLVSNAPDGARTMVAVSWIFFILAVLFGVLTLGALTGSLSNNKASIMETNMRAPAIVHVGSFIIGLVLIVIAGWWAL
jgi:hypothetical protein